ncbi:uncharacterized protein LOC143186434 [Calliopsis andreniformis]|uniref:uncharacterized protein LOC143186434 n=1 Tax=Calliopsis andreniformis TaxID=337506 RepID=UPI003FCD6BAF
MSSLDITTPERDIEIVGESRASTGFIVVGILYKIVNTITHHKDRQHWRLRLVRIVSISRTTSGFVVVGNSTTEQPRTVTRGSSELTDFVPLQPLLRQLKSLTLERGRIKSALTRFKTFVYSLKPDADIDSLDMRFKKNQQLYDKFDQVQSQIEILVADTDQETVHINERDAFETAYFDLMAKVEKYIAKFRSSNQPAATSNASPLTLVETQNTPRLPTIVLPSFDGNYNNWLKFRDTFESLIHNNESLTDIQRFHYLNSALKGPAARVIQSLGVSDANYKLAWATLKRRFEDVKSLIHHHASALLELPRVHKQSSVALREFIDTANNHILALGALGESIHTWDILVILILTNKLDSCTCKEWEKLYLGMTDSPKFKDFVEFIEQQAKLLERLSSKAINNQPKLGNTHVEYSKSRNRIDQVASHVVSTDSQCLFCKAGHLLQNCTKLKAMPYAERHETVKKLQCCFNCLQQGHSIKGCTRGKCRVCGKKHHTLLHRDNAIVERVGNAQVTTHAASSDTPIQSCVSNSNSSTSMSYTVLSTALVYIQDINGEFHECRALLDVGSQAHFISESFCKKLGLPSTVIDAKVGGLGKANNSIRAKLEIKLKSRCNSFQSNISCFVIRDITEDMPSVPLGGTAIPIPEGITLADPHFASPSRVDLLIGAGLFWQLLCIGQHKIPFENLVWQKTRLGWVLGGSLNWSVNNSKKPVDTCHIVSNESLQKAISQFWEIENYNYTPVKQVNIENVCEQYFKDTITRNNEGRYIVSVPFNNKIHELGESRSQAEKRLFNMERKFFKQSELRNQYIEFMKEYEKLGHMSRISEDLIKPDFCYYLPHHAVYKESSTTTKLRVVFDGSAKTSSGISLNDAQFIGVTVQSDLFSILLRFRKHRFILSADIEKMYRQILVRPADRKFQRILWRSNVNLPISTYELNTITYGTASAPFLATRVLKEIGLEHSEGYPLASRAIIEDFYVDDLLTGCDTVLDALVLKKELNQILNQAGFHLRKWASNDSRILSNLDNSRQSLEIKDADKESKTLGLLWLLEPDELRYSVKSHLRNRITKRTVLSETAQIFDPLGLIGPVITTAKLFMQRIWQLQLEWDETLPQDLHTQWTTFRSELVIISSFSIPRRVVCDNVQQVELHGFSDASEKAYGACVYLRTWDTSGIWTVRLLCAKSRVAPLKSISLPRLELCAALLLAQLISKVKDSIQLNIDQMYFWSDSTIVIAWLRGQPMRWKTFVANRISEIQDLTDIDSWKHISSSDNPADVISRGTSPKNLKDNSLWWFGPAWLIQDISQWPSANEAIPEIVPEERKGQTGFISSLSAVPRQTVDIFLKYSSFTKLRRVTAYCLKFIRTTLERVHSSKNRGIQVNVQGNRTHKPLTTDELLDAQIVLIKLVQEESFAKELDSLKANKLLPLKSKLILLNPFLDERGVIRVGGRLRNAPTNFDQKHPVIVPMNHPFTTLLVKHEHHRLLHAGIQQTLASLRSRFWILSGKSVVKKKKKKKILRKCVRCFRATPTGISYVMGNLPASRVTPARPFNTCGVDYAGPFLLKERGRSKITYKSYICIFVCFVTKAIHIELATDLSTEAFLNCLYRFIARRGRIRCIYSDNGTNFVGAKHELNEISKLLNNRAHNERVENILSQEDIQWHLIPPYSPHFGGLWESAVKSTKYHLKRVIGDQRLTFEELYTILTQIEACLNSRPLQPLSNDPTDLTPLTPGHFLVGDALTAPPQVDLLHIKLNRLNRYQLVQQTVQHFWKRWQQEYLHELQQRYKWQMNNSSDIRIGMLVVIREDNTPPLRWRLGRIVELHPGSDGIVRVVSIKVPEGIIKRPSTKICVLPIEEESADTST